MTYVKLIFYMNLAVVLAVIVSLLWFTLPPVVWTVNTFPGMAHACPGDTIEYQLEGNILRSQPVKIVWDWKTADENHNSVLGTQESFELPTLAGHFADLDAHTDVPEFLAPGDYERVIQIVSLGGLSRTAQRSQHVRVYDCDVWEGPYGE